MRESTRSATIHTDPSDLRRTQGPHARAGCCPTRQPCAKTILRVSRPGVPGQGRSACPAAHRCAPDHEYAGVSTDLTPMDSFNGSQKCSRSSPGRETNQTAAAAPLPAGGRTLGRPVVHKDSGTRGCERGPRRLHGLFGPLSTTCPARFLDHEHRGVRDYCDAPRVRATSTRYDHRAELPTRGATLTPTCPVQRSSE